VSTEDPEERSKAVRTLLADETRLGLLVGVAVGFELASELASARAQAGTPDTQPTDLPPTPIDKES
jgi:hypothetical protein